MSKPLRDPGTIKHLQSVATNVVQTAACRPQNHLCLGTFQEASLNIIGNARLVSLVGPVVLIRCWFDDVAVMGMKARVDDLNTRLGHFLVG